MANQPLTQLMVDLRRQQTGLYDKQYDWQTEGYRGSADSVAYAINIERYVGDKERLNEQK